MITYSVSLIKIGIYYTLLQGINKPCEVILYWIASRKNTVSAIA